MHNPSILSSSPLCSTLSGLSNVTLSALPESDDNDCHMKGHQEEWQRYWRIFFFFLAIFSASVPSPLKESCWCHPVQYFDKEVLPVGIVAEGLDDKNNIKSSHHVSAPVTKKWAFLWPLYPRPLEKILPPWRCSILSLSKQQKIFKPGKVINKIFTWLGLHYPTPTQKKKERIFTGSYIGRDAWLSFLPQGRVPKPGPEKVR